MLETPAGQPPRSRQVEGFSALSMAGGYLARPAGCWKGGKADVVMYRQKRIISSRRLLEGWESRPRVPVPATTPRLHAARRAAPKKPKKKGILPDALAPLPTELLPIAVMVC